MTGDAEIVTGDPRWYNFSTGASPLVYLFTGVEAGGAVGRDVTLLFEILKVYSEMID